MREQVRRDLQAAVDNEDINRKAYAVLGKITGMKREETVKKIEEMVSNGLRAVTGDDSYSFSIKMMDRKQVQYAMMVGRLGREVSFKDCGGGVQEIVAFLLRLMTVILRNDGGRSILILDEPFKFISSDYHERLSNLISDLAKTGVQFILVSHQDDVIPPGALVHKVTNSNGTSKIEK
jgi:DNA repair exonuclease SbcCD ATPase subunit